MPDQIPPGCVSFKTHLDLLNMQLAVLQQALDGADHADKAQARNAIRKKQQEVNITKNACNNCTAKPPIINLPSPVHTPVLPYACVPLYKQRNALNFNVVA